MKIIINFTSAKRWMIIVSFFRWAECRLVFWLMILRSMSQIFNAPRGDPWVALSFGHLGSFLFPLWIILFTTEMRVLRSTTADLLRQFFIQLQEECQNYIRLFVRQTKEKFVVCGTNAYKPMCRQYIQLEVYNNNLWRKQSE